MTGQEIAWETMNFCIFMGICIFGELSILTFLLACLCEVYGVRVMW